MRELGCRWMVTKGRGAGEEAEQEEDEVGAAASRLRRFLGVRELFVSLCPARWSMAVMSLVTVVKASRSAYCSYLTQPRASPVTHSFVFGFASKLHSNFFNALNPATRSSLSSQPSIPPQTLNFSTSGAKRLSFSLLGRMAGEGPMASFRIDGNLR